MEKEKERLRRYGAVFSEEDRQRWEAAVRTAV